ncbi:MAG: cation:proton antiporter [Prevotella sp.]|nr:cation:proton antiporter [Prevotella sp.]
MLNISQYFPITDPTLIFFVVLLIILFAPIVMGRLRIPHIIGMVIAGVLIGQYGLNILERDASFELFGKVGLYYIMFLAGLEMDMEGLKKNKGRVALFALLTFSAPFIMTFFTGINMLGYSTLAALLLGSLMASNTLIAYPIVGRYGLQRHITSTLSVGSSMVSLFIALVVMAALVSSFKSSGGALFWLLFVLKLVLFCAGMIFVIPRLTRWFLRRYSDAVMQFIFVMAVMFLSAALSDFIGLEGIFGAFFAGLILNRFIPMVSPLMNRIEFIGNALFIPYFLIGVGMLINVRLLFQGGNILWVVLFFVVIGTAGKAVAAYLAGFLFRFPLSWAHMMLGLTSAHAAGAIAMVMVGINLEIAPGKYLFGDEVLNGIVIMILFTCIISTMVTEYSAKMIRLKEKDSIQNDRQPADDEKILIPVKYPEYADNLLSMAMMMRNPKLNRGLVALNVVYDDTNAKKNQADGHRLLEHLQRTASAADVPMQAQVRIAANIANGIKHAFKEFQASEIIMGLHFHQEISTKFWGQFTQSLYNGLNRQIMIARIMQPLNTIRRIQVAVPSRAEFEPGFYRWLERLTRMAGNLDCRIQFHGRQESLDLIGEFIQNRHPNVRTELTPMGHWNELPELASHIKEDHMFVVVTARKGTISYKNALERLPEEINQHFSGTTLMIVFPDQYGAPDDSMTFAQAQHTEERSVYEALIEWIQKKIKV